jgi:dual specificity protein kinase YAK1
MEVSVLDLVCPTAVDRWNLLTVHQLNSKLDKNDDHHLLRLKDTFIHRQHLCLVFELLSVNLYELIKQNQFRGLSTTLVRVFAQQLLNGLSLLNKARLIHCDLKPENILLKNLESPIIKIIDFGSACDERQTVYTYIQSRFYRSPEVLLGLPYSSAIDMWSLGCIVVELFLGLPLFPGSSEYNQVSRIVEMLGNPPNWMLEMGKQAGDFFEKRHDVDDYGRRTYHLKSMEQYSRERGTKEQPSKKYFQATTLPDIIRSYAMPRKNMKPAEIERGKTMRPPKDFLPRS